mmetsp:Transcript_17601/g.15754  ORF Transcript_17601/g.15754 Transcript_17601/m.15754 type:complete len:140 (+) Transcript_17601:60-479(+)
MNCARKLKNNRKKNKYAGKSKSKPSNKRQPKNSHYKGVVIDKIGIETKQPNSGIRKCVRVQLVSTGERVNAYIPFDGGSNWINENDEVTIERHHKPIGDIPGVKYKVIKIYTRSMTYYNKYGIVCRACQRIARQNKHRH